MNKNIYSTRHYFIKFIESGCIPKNKVNDALQLLNITPTGTQWRNFIDVTLLWLGGLALSFSVLFFIAYNWDGIDRFAKFAMVEVFIILSVAAYYKCDSGSTTAKVSLLMASIFLGVLLALYGQIYQTGADPWQLFFNWALLMLPWAFIARFSVIWIVWALLINLSIVLYHQTFRGAFGFVFSSDFEMLWQIFVFNITTLLIWELLKHKQEWPWLSAPWATRLLAVWSGIAITWLMIHTIIETQTTSGLPVLVWFAWLGSLYFIYRNIKPDLFMLAGCCLSFTVVFIVFVADQLFAGREGAGSYLFLTLLVVGLGAGSAIWLKNINKALQK